MTLCQECQNRDPDEKYGICWYNEAPNDNLVCYKWNIETYILYHLGSHKMSSYTLTELVDSLKINYSAETTKIKLQKLLRQLVHKKKLGCQQIGKEFQYFSVEKIICHR